ncbi:hypothetical protein RNJ44_04725 [Nakaseomyces bracarensis]|uniref:Uncharacterized protein n=1 Tax=Nakaseomyces bracarensis TaxID=273131 RepID=A0ABR4NVQ5_9SACH
MSYCFRSYTGPKKNLTISSKTRHFDNNNYVLEVLDIISATNFLIEITENYYLVQELSINFNKIHELVLKNYLELDQKEIITTNKENSENSNILGYLLLSRKSNEQLPNFPSLFYGSIMLVSTQWLLATTVKQVLVFLDDL